MTKVTAKVKILKNDRVNIIIKGFNIIPYRKGTLKYVENNNRLILILRHLSRFDIKKKELMVLDGNIVIENISISVGSFNHNQIKYLESFYKAAEKTIWTKESNIRQSNVVLLCNEEIPEINIIYGYDE